MDRRRLQQIASGGAFLAVCAVAVFIVVSLGGGGGSGGDTDLEDVALVRSELRGIPQHRTVLGDRDARVRVIEFADLQCPICREFSVRTGSDLISEAVRDGTVTYELRQWPVIGRPPHTQSTEAARGALAASEQGHYWNFVELFYRNQGAEESGYVNDEFLSAIARGAGVPDIKRWDRERHSPRWDEALARTEAEAADLGFTGTPSVVVEGPGGRQTLTVPSLDDVEDAIRAVE